VAEKSRSNYAQTTLSLASSLNMDYLDFVSDEVGSQSTDDLPLARLIRWNEVRRLLRERGYQTIAFSTGNRVTELENADLVLRSSKSHVSMFERLVMDTTGLVLYHDLAEQFDWPAARFGYQEQRERITFTLDALGKVAAESGPKFVFAHLITPHPPFVFGPNGEQVNQRYMYTFMEGMGKFPGTPDDYIAGYKAQLSYINLAVQEVISAILASSEAPPIIILQGDHGPASRLDWDAPGSDALRERMAILNAYYLPGVSHDRMHSTLTPVNSFRIVFNQYFDAEYSLLPDKSYFSTLEQPYHFIPVPEEDAISH